MESAAPVHSWSQSPRWSGGKRQHEKFGVVVLSQGRRQGRSSRGSPALPASGASWLADRFARGPIRGVGAPRSVKGVQVAETEGERRSCVELDRRRSSPLAGGRRCCLGPAGSIAESVSAQVAHNQWFRLASAAAPPPLTWPAPSTSEPATLKMCLVDRTAALASRRVGRGCRWWPRSTPRTVAHHIVA